MTGQFELLDLLNGSEREDQCGAAISRSGALWLLRNLSGNDISPDGEGMTQPELREAMTSYIRP